MPFVAYTKMKTKTGAIGRRRVSRAGVGAPPASHPELASRAEPRRVPRGGRPSDFISVQEPGRAWQISPLVSGRLSLPLGCAALFEVLEAGTLQRDPYGICAGPGRRVRADCGLCPPGPRRTPRAFHHGLRQLPGEKLFFRKKKIKNQMEK